MNLESDKDLKMCDGSIVIRLGAIGGQRKIGGQRVAKNVEKLLIADDNMQQN